MSKNPDDSDFPVVDDVVSKPDKDIIIPPKYVLTPVGEILESVTLDGKEQWKKWRHNNIKFKIKPGVDGKKWVINQTLREILENPEPEPRKSIWQRFKEFVWRCRGFKFDKKSWIIMKCFHLTPKEAIKVIKQYRRSHVS